MIDEKPSFVRIEVFHWKIIMRRVIVIFFSENHNTGSVGMSQISQAEGGGQKPVDNQEKIGYNIDKFQCEVCHGRTKDGFDFQSLLR